VNSKIERLTPRQYEIIAEICTVVAKLNGSIGLLTAIGSWGDNLPESEVLALLQDWNSKHHYNSST